VIASDPRNVAQGWFAEGDGPPEGHEAATRVRPAAFDAWDCRLYEPHYKMQAACPAAAGHVARFRLRDYFEHKLTTGPFATKYSAWTKHVGGEFGVTWPELRLPASAHGGWLHERIQQRRPSGSGLGGGVVTRPAQSSMAARFHELPATPHELVNMYVDRTLAFGRRYFAYPS
jgi:hypothetical protein